MNQVGLIGVGAMGKGVLKNLVKHGYRVVAYDNSPAGQENVRAHGGELAAHPSMAAEGSKAIFLSLPNPKIVREVLVGEEGILQNMQEGASIFDLSTIDPSTAREMAVICGQKGITYYDCPVSGGPTGADQGTMTIMVGGSKEGFAASYDLLRCIGENIEYIGETGMAQALKLCHNMVVAATTVALGEAFATGVKQGLDIERMADVIGKSVGSSRTLSFFGPNIVQGDYENIKFMLNHMHKDVGLYQEMAKESGVPTMIGAPTYNLYQAAKVQGKGHLDHTAVCQVIEAFSATKLTGEK